VNEFLDWAQKVAPILAGFLVPIVTGVVLPLMGVRKEPRDPSAVRSMSRHAKLHEALPEESRAPIQKLLEFEAAKYARTLMRKGTRKLNGGNLAAVIFIGVLTGVVEYFLVYFAFSWWPALLIAGAVFGFSAALLSAGFTQMYVYEEGDPLETAKPKDSGAAIQSSSDIMTNA
jgi:hypothetical protein